MVSISAPAWIVTLAAGIAAVLIIGGTIWMTAMYVTMRAIKREFQDNASDHAEYWRRHNAADKAISGLREKIASIVRG